jgi:hypothetical protein
MSFQFVCSLPLLLTDTVFDLDSFSHQIVLQRLRARTTITLCFCTQTSLSCLDAKLAMPTLVGLTALYIYCFTLSCLFCGIFFLSSRVNYLSTMLFIDCNNTHLVTLRSRLSSPWSSWVSICILALSNLRFGSPDSLSFKVILLHP